MCMCDGERLNAILGNKIQLLVLGGTRFEKLGERQRWDILSGCQLRTERDFRHLNAVLHIADEAAGGRQREKVEREGSHHHLNTSWVHGYAWGEVSARPVSGTSKGFRGQSCRAAAMHLHRARPFEVERAKDGDRLRVVDEDGGGAHGAA